MMGAPPLDSVEREAASCEKSAFYAPIPCSTEQAIFVRAIREYMLENSE
jgi:hypothetical protein